MFHGYLGKWKSNNINELINYLSLKIDKNKIKEVEFENDWNVIFINSWMLHSNMRRTYGDVLHRKDIEEIEEDRESKKYWIIFNNREGVWSYDFYKCFFFNIINYEI